MVVGRRPSGSGIRGSVPLLSRWRRDPPDSNTLHARRRLVHFNVPEHPTAASTAQQVVDAVPWNEAPRYLLRDRDCIYGATPRQRVRTMGIEEVVIAPGVRGRIPPSSGSLEVSAATARTT